MEYITCKKVSIAKDFLQKGHPINSVCINLGFEGYSSFFRIFRKIVGGWPQEYVEGYIKS
jgi:methylphosphotriester-DNA--protein-cysteine methyltransferase